MAKNDEGVVLGVGGPMMSLRVHRRIVRVHACTNRPSSRHGDRQPGLEITTLFLLPLGPDWLSASPNGANINWIVQIHPSILLIS